MNRKNLYEKSVEVILKQQSQYGSFPACPNFDKFRYCFLRDATFTAHAALLSGHQDAARRYYLWADQAIRKCIPVIERLERKLQSGIAPGAEDFLPARFTMAGEMEPVDSGWPNFQTDCYGAWLWGLAEYVERTGERDLLEICDTSIRMILKYLTLTWEMPCYDPWEEIGDERAASSIGSVAGGFLAINRFLGLPEISEDAERMQAVLRSAATPEGYLPKSLSRQEIDSSVLWLFVPFHVFEDDDPLTAASVQKVERELVPGGVKRYLGDRYYGGGEWFVQTCWLAWYYSSTGKRDKAERLLRWCEDHAYENGELTEQVLEHLNHPECLDDWRKNWRQEPPAPMLWAHAMYIIACLDAEQEICGYRCQHNDDLITQDHHEHG